MAAGRTDIRVNSGREGSHGTARAARLERALDAAQSLSDVLWEELREQLGCSHATGDGGPPGSIAMRRYAQLAEGVGDLASTVALLADVGGGPAPAPDPGERIALRPSGAAGPETGAPRVAVLVDERDERSDASLHERAAEARRREGRRDAPSTHDSWASEARRAHDGLEESDREEPQAWLALIEDALSRFERDHTPFAALLIEALDGGVRAGVGDEIARAVSGALDASAPVSIVPECSNRYWLLVPRADRVRARALADRLECAREPVEDATRRSDAAERYFAAISARRPQARSDAAPNVRLVAGTAVCPDDGRDLHALVAQAHIELAAARSASAPLAAVAEHAQR